MDTEPASLDPLRLTDEEPDPDPAPETHKETPPPPRAQDEESTAWLLDQLPDPGTGQARDAPAPPAASETPETREQTYQFGGEPEGEHDPSFMTEPHEQRLRSIRPPSSPQTRGNTMRIAIAATEFNYDITSMMLERARAHADVLGAEVSHIVRVPGVYDLPLAAKRLMVRGDVDGVVALGCVIEGETDHDDLVIQHAARKLIDLSLENDKPVGLGITGPGMSRLQAMSRIDRAKDAVEAAIRMHRELAAL